MENHSLHLWISHWKINSIFQQLTHRFRKHEWFTTVPQAQQGKNNQIKPEINSNGCNLKKAESGLDMGSTISSFHNAFFWGWLLPFIVITVIYIFKFFIAISYDGFTGFGALITAPYFFVIIGSLNLWVLALQNRLRKRLFLFLAGFAVPLIGFLLLFFCR